MEEIKGIEKVVAGNRGGVVSVQMVANNNNINSNNNTDENVNSSGGNSSGPSLPIRKKGSSSVAAEINISSGNSNSLNVTGSSGAAARQLVQTLVDNGIISPGNKSTIRVVDTLNLGSSQV